MKSLPTLRADVLVVGSGIAGLCTALTCDDLSVHVLTKASLHSGGSSFWAQGGVAAAIGRNDSPKLHAGDTIMAGAGLSEPEVTDLLTREAAEAIDFLAELGTRFDLNEDGEFQLAREAAHGMPRVLHANRDATGRELMRALALAAQRDENLTLHESHRAIEVLLDDAGQACGVVVDAGGEPRVILARAVVMATGGSGQLFQYTTNPPEAAAEGLALAARVGAELADVEFVQFHPTALHTPVDPLPLITEALRGEGALLVDEDGRRFMLDEHPLAELAPRDVVARGVWKVLASGHKTFLDARPALGRAFPEHFPTVFEYCQEHGIDPRIQPMPVVPAAHYHMGGIAVDLDGRTSVPGLWACGEVSSTGVHGANRLASNSLLEAVVFGKRVAQSIRGFAPQSAGVPSPRPETYHLSEPAEPCVVARMRKTMWDAVGLMREEQHLTQAIDEFRQIYEDHGPGRIRDRARICWVIAAAARARRESRGAHYRSDFPGTSPEFKRHSRTRWNHERHEWVVEFEEDLVPVGS